MADEIDLSRYEGHNLDKYEAFRNTYLNPASLRFLEDAPRILAAYKEAVARAEKAEARVVDAEARRETAEARVLELEKAADDCVQRNSAGGVRGLKKALATLRAGES